LQNKLPEAIRAKWLYAENDLWAAYKDKMKQKVSQVAVPPNLPAYEAKTRPNNG
jgi:hypothetical protein